MIEKRTVLVVALCLVTADARPEDGGRSHWAFRALRRSALPAVKNGAWAEGSIDHFVLARLESAGLTPSPRAHRRTLIRRAHVDLTGLPPTYREVEAFVGDRSPDAFARVVDGLLSRQNYGQRWGRRWLDVARYADTKGYVDAGEPRFPFAYTYRDYVIRAFNEDLPYDRFVLEQIAADRLDDGDGTRSLAALGFLTVGSRFNFFPQEIIDDRIDVVTRGLMGLTVGCARCHDHKYDPISTEDYYSLYGIFASSTEPSPDKYPLLRSIADGARDDDELVKKVEEKAAAYRQRRTELHEQIMREMRAWAGDYLRYIVQTMPEHRTRAQPPLRTKRGLVREVTAYGRGGVGRWRRFIDGCGPDDSVFGLWNRLVVVAREDLARTVPGVLEDLQSAGSINALVAAAFVAKPPATMVDIADVYGALLEETAVLWNKERDRDATIESFDGVAREELRLVLHGAGAPATMTLDESADLYHLDEHVDVRKKHAEIERAFLGAKDPLPRAMVLVDRREPVEPHVFIRGDPERRGRPVKRRFPRLLSHVSAAPFTAGSGRLELARAVVHPENPLTARVLVNRIWAWHFGQGFVDTPSDFGVRSSPPSHPELLDWLASRFIDGGWSIKQLHRLILLSSTWQQAGDDRPPCREVDVQNRLLWRQNRRRLDFESMRDSMLAVAGQLDTLSGGRPVNGRPDDPSISRRAVYCVVDREHLPGVLRVFDFPSPDISAPERSRTTVPQQALFLFNSPFVIAQAEALEAGLARMFSGDDIEGRIRHLHRRLHGRDADPEEIELALRFIASRRAAAAGATMPSGSREWQYGFGKYDAAGGRLESFTRMPHFDGENWQGGPKWPDSEFRYLRISATGGHVGNDHAHAAVRRWTAPRDGTIRIGGSLRHGATEDCGEGVRAWTVSSGAGQLGHWTAFKSTVDTAVGPVTVRAGDTVDFVVDCGDNHRCDLFDWAPSVRLDSSGGSVAGAGEIRMLWEAEEDFGGIDPPRELLPWAVYAQALLQSNEFLFVD